MRLSPKRTAHEKFISTLLHLRVTVKRFLGDWGRNIGLAGREGRQKQALVFTPDANGTASLGRLGATLTSWSSASENPDKWLATGQASGCGHCNCTSVREGQHGVFDALRQ